MFECGRRCGHVRRAGGCGVLVLVVLGVGVGC
jgi:hypothetical protein